MSNDTRINTIKINELPESDILSDSDILIQEDSATHKIRLSTLINFIKDHSSIIDTFVRRLEINKENGIAPLDADKKIPSGNINFGREKGQVYDGSEGALLRSNVDDHIASKSNPHNVTKTQIGLSNVDNTSDIDKPVSTAQQTALDLKANKTSVYTKNEVDNKFSTLETNIDWKESVSSYGDIAAVYPNPADGWTVNVKDTDYTYRYNGTSWVAISANAIPKATDNVDGLLSKEDHAAYDAAKAHADSSHARTDATRTERSAVNGNIIIDGTETAIYTHPGGTNPHGTTKSDVGLGNVPDVATNDQTPTYAEASALEKLSSGERLSAAFGKISKAVADLISHINDKVRHITSSERADWTTAYTHSQSAHAPTDAESNVIETVKVNGTALTPSSKAVDVIVPTKISQLTNDTGIYLDTASGQLTASTFKGKLSGNADTATRAAQDSAGNVITDTYATKAELGEALESCSNEITSDTEPANQSAGQYWIKEY